ncbi:MAG: hypothetical protein ACRCT8_07570 [Lacipirellulaceae bacterium]
MSERPWLVVKLGGSLLAQPRGIARFVEWLDSPQAACGAASRLVVVGGGPVVDALRAIHVANGLADEASHWGAIDAMDVNARLVASAARSLGFTDALPQDGQSGDLVLAPGRLLREDEPDWPGEPLPASWDVTSDSIAARIAVRLRAGLVLVKSGPWPAGVEPGDWVSAAARGYVDRWFSRVAPTETRVARLK